MSSIQIAWVRGALTCWAGWPACAGPANPLSKSNTIFSSILRRAPLKHFGNCSEFP